MTHHRSFESVQSPRTSLDRVRLGFLSLTDCAPLVIAKERGFFREEGLDVTLSREPSWATVRDKLAVGAIEGAQLLAPMSLSTSLGIDGVDVPLTVPMCLDLGGNAITVSVPLAERILEASPDAARDALAAGIGLRSVIEQDLRNDRTPLVFAVVFPFSSHNYLLRYWLAAAGIDPDRDVRILVAPPSSMASMLEQGSIDGYCVGEPWNALARSRQLGRTLLTSFDIWPNAPEKVLALRRGWAEDRPEIVRAIVRALVRTCRWLDRSENRKEAVHVISGVSHVDARVDVVAESMEGRVADLRGDLRSLPDMHVFYRNAANFPWRSQAAWFVAQMIRWGQLEKLPDVRAVIESVYRPDIFREVAQELGIAVPSVDWKTEGAQVEQWVLEDATVPIPMSADRFMDGTVFDPQDLAGYLESFDVSSLRIRVDEIPLDMSLVD